MRNGGGRASGPIFAAGCGLQEAGWRVLALKFYCFGGEPRGPINVVQVSLEPTGASQKAWQRGSTLWAQQFADPRHEPRPGLDRGVLNLRATKHGVAAVSWTASLEKRKTLYVNRRCEAISFEIRGGSQGTKKI